MTIHRKPITDTIFKTTGIGHHVDRAADTLAYFRNSAGETVSVACTLLLANDKLVLNDIHKFQISSVVSYALQYGEDPVAAIDSARERGHKMVWINGLASVISLVQFAPEPYIRVRHGMPVVFQGVVYRIDPDRNRNLKLTPYVPSNAAEVA